MKTRTIPAYLAPKLAALTVLMTAALQADTLDLSSHFDAASDFTAMSVEFNYEEVMDNPPILTTNFTTSITDLGGSPNVIEFLVDRDDAGAAALSFLSTATFDPSTQGMLRSIDWSMDVTDPDTALKDDGANFPLLVQGGTLFRYTGGDIQDSDHGTDNAFMNFNADTFPQSLSGAVATDFEELDVTTPDWTDGFGPVVVAASHPDFSETGGEITFGYLTTSRTSDVGGQSNETRHEGTVVTLTFGPPELLHHWKLDETSGLVAADSVGGLDLTLQGFADTTSHWV
ncbi:MAG: hypothetical protein GY724_12590, partial [Actinomycetia bacterium]|nr:hypothetical protein [Actinomycetes bacterium]